MTLYRSMGRGSWIVRRKLLGIRVQRATGLYERADAAQLEATLVKLAHHGRRDLIAAFVAGQVEGPELMAGVERYGLSFQLAVTSVVRLRRAMHEWLRSAELAERTRRDYRWSLGVLVGGLPPIDREPTAAERRALHRGPDLRDLPRLLARYARRAKPVMFVQVRAAAQSFVRDTVPKGQHSELWRDLAAVQGPKRRRRDVQGGLAPARAREVAEKLGRFGPMWWTLCCTGMESKEYWRAGGFDVLLDRILIHGTKRESRDRVVMRLTTPVRPLLGVRAFRRRLKAVGDALGIPKLTPYVGRRTFSHFLELAGILDSRCDAYMGHSPKSDRAKYREHDVVPYLAEDAKAIRAKIGADPVYVRALA